MTDPLYKPSPAAPTEPAVLVAVNRVSWPAIFAGVALALAVQLLLNLLGVGVGAAVFDLDGAGSVSIASGLWFALSGVIAALTGGFAASRLSGRAGTTTGVLHGLTAWAVTTLIVVYLLSTSAGALVGGALGGLSAVLGNAGRTVETAETAAAMVSTGAFFGFFSLLLGAVAAWIGGWWGVRRLEVMSEIS